MVSVDTLDSSFQPEALFSAPGDAVVWTRSGALPHTTTSGINGNPDGIRDSGTLANGRSFSCVFAEEGDFSHRCTLRYPGGVTGSVTVSASGGGGKGEGRRFQAGTNDLGALAPGLYVMPPPDPEFASAMLMIAR